MNRDSRRLRLVLAVLVLISFSLITLDVRSGRGGAFSPFRQAASALFGPVERGAASVGRPVGHFLAGLGHTGGDRARADRLQRQVDDLQAQLHSAGDLSRERAELSRLVALASSKRLTVVPARVVSLGDLSGFDKAATLDVGSRDGVRTDMTVVAGGGLVGRVLSVAPFTCTVVLADDPDAVVGARLQRSAEAGLLSGHGNGALTYAPADPNVRPRRGDAVETFGSLYVPDVPIGTVTSVAPTPGKTTLTATVSPFVDYTGLDVVGVVVQSPRTRPATATLPPQPTRTVTVTAPPPSAPPSGG